MINDKSLNDKAYSFGKNNVNSLDVQTQEFKTDSNKKPTERGRIQKPHKENKTSGGVLLTFGMDKENCK